MPARGRVGSGVHKHSSGGRGSQLTSSLNEASVLNASAHDCELSATTLRKRPVHT